MKNKKIILTAFLFFCVIFMCLACTQPKTMIIFNDKPITKDNFLNNATEFSVGKRIYYLFITEKPLDCELIRVRVLKRNAKANYEITGLAYSNDYRLSKEQIYYYNDYIVLNEAGYYCMAIYSKTKLDQALAIADFYVK